MPAFAETPLPSAPPSLDWDLDAPPLFDDEPVASAPEISEPVPARSPAKPSLTVAAPVVTPGPWAADPLGVLAREEEDRVDDGDPRVRDPAMAGRRREGRRVAAVVACGAAALAVASVTGGSGGEQAAPVVSAPEQAAVASTAARAVTVAQTTTDTARANARKEARARRARVLRRERVRAARKARERRVSAARARAQAVAPKVSFRTAPAPAVTAPVPRPVAPVHAAPPAVAHHSLSESSKAAADREFGL